MKENTRRWIELIIVLMGLNYWVCGYTLAAIILYAVWSIIQLAQFNYDERLEIGLISSILLTLFCIYSLMFHKAFIIDGFVWFYILLAVIESCAIKQNLLNMDYSFNCQKRWLLVGITIIMIPQNIYQRLGYDVLTCLKKSELIGIVIIIIIPYLVSGGINRYRIVGKQLKTLQTVSAAIKNVVK